LEQGALDDAGIAVAIINHCILLLNGHQSKSLLLNSGAVLLNNPDEIEFSCQPNSLINYQANSLALSA